MVIDGLCYRVGAITQVYKLGSAYGSEHLRIILRVIWGAEFESAFRFSRLILVWEISQPQSGVFGGNMLFEKGRKITQNQQI